MFFVVGGRHSAHSKYNLGPESIPKQSIRKAARESVARHSTKMEDSGAILCHISLLKDMLDQVIHLNSIILHTPISKFTD